jgi:hypothetical protein
MNTERQSDQQDIDFAKKIVARLNEGTRDFDAATAAKLLAARKEALAHFGAAPAHSPAMEWVTAGAQRLGAPFGGNWRVGFAILALAAAAAGAMVWHGMQTQGNEIAEIDEGLLTDELPINAYLDKGFDAWAKRYSR